MARRRRRKIRTHTHTRRAPGSFFRRCCCCSIRRAPRAGCSCWAARVLAPAAAAAVRGVLCYEPFICWLQFRARWRRCAQLRARGLPVSRAAGPDARPEHKTAHAAPKHTHRTTGTVQAHITNSAGPAFMYQQIRKAMQMVLGIGIVLRAMTKQQRV